jgi:hypothetical protein
MPGGAIQRHALDPEMRSTLSSALLHSSVQAPFFGAATSLVSRLQRSCRNLTGIDSNYLDQRAVRIKRW